MIKTIQPAKSLKGKLVMPPDKSIAHRSAMFAALADTKSEIRNYSPAADPQSTLSCLRSLGVNIEKQKNNVILIDGVGRDGFKTPAKPLDCGNSGTTMRLMAGILAGAGIRCTLTGDDSLSKRTMKRIFDPLRSMGAQITGREGMYAPIKIEPHAGIRGIRYSLPIPSAQLKSCVLLAGLFGKDPTIVIETVQSRDHTERLLDLKVETFGADKRIISSLQHSIPAQNYTVPGDFSAASFWLAAGAIHPSSKIVLPETGINPSRTAFLTILKEMGANITLGNELMQGKEPVADITITSSELHAIELQPSVIANCIDELPILMIVMCFAKGTSVIRGAGELRHKETDRLKAMGNILSLAGADFEMFEDGINITGNREFKPKSAIFESEHDHRIAMSAAVLSLMANENSKIIGAECTDISYPGFWRDLQLLIEQ